ncbi:MULTISPECIES: LTA synthase family protein [Pseudoalteromonas]|jgi:phosphoglycerol transferase MdoB-like AlkP superfamily enzyme|uniref:Phosphoglycerol transferase I n=2 Tax=Pseudoalteromonas TaxID=53246 RepID=A0A9W4QXA3_PSEHA|nr:MULTISPECIES: LTA synthase family protein [Pseudoalteromonas]MDN3490179.1 LTA synthase family protein [Pseudoalteromonas sp. APC 3694]CAH9056807.1 Phosphoglycerol transferase I [Pseudoalteromonas haloplanktis]HCP96535.1 LTA synthase family protein [Pseudoalteromonas sp.]|tara:strand:+ start:53289 stop:55244 length:1956 start_codon:yes stop_codon:yes gene_type:complete
MTANTSVLKPLLRFTIILISIFITSRIALLFWQHSRLNDGDIWPIISGAIRIDLSSIGYLATIGVFILILHVVARPKTELFQRIFTLYGSCVVTVVVIVEASTPAFINQYDVRPNRLYIEYLDYPQEVFSMLVHGHLFAMLSTLLLASLTSVYSYRLLCRAFTQPPSLKKASNLPILMAALIICLFAARGTLNHRPLNPALVYFSQDSLVNSLVLNSTYSVAFALKNMGNEKSASNLYGTMLRQQIIDTVKKASYRKQFVVGNIPTLAHNKPFVSGVKKNLVIILEESLGARFVGELGGLDITPELDKLYQQGWGFDNLYATGTRSVRGIEAITTGFTPSPSRSVVKLSKSQHNFFSLADVFSQEGYKTQFIYGGESHFDNMKSFFLGNGFNDIVDINHIDNPQFISSWGVSDEDLFNQADKELTKLSNSTEPFFSLVFTSSNHDPFDIPQGKVSLPKGHNPENYKRDLAIKYADYALGKFINKAKTRSYWENTVFLVVADHDVRVFGSEPVPLKSFHIPAVILNSDMKSKRDPRLVSQIDLPVTLMSLLGIDQATPMLGFDLTKSYPVERAMMQYYDNFAYLENDRAVILMPNQQTSYWRYNKQTKIQEKNEQLNVDQTLAEKALAHVLFSNLAYTEQLYRLADKSSDKE